jgi:uncharacterized protein YPO0396
MPAPREGKPRAEAMDDKDFMSECHKRANRIQELLQAHPDASNALRRKVTDEKLDAKLLTQVEKEQRELERASKRFRKQESLAKEEVQSATQATQAARVVQAQATHAAQAVQAQAAWKDYWACSRVEELGACLHAEKLRADDLARKVALYEHRFGRIY